MRCGTARNRVLQRRDVSMPGDLARELEAHLQSCSRCALWARDQELLRGWVADLPVAEPSPNFDWRLRLRLSKLGPATAPALFEPARHGWRASFEFAAAAAAAAVVVVAAGTWLGRSPQAPPSAPPAAAWNAPRPVGVSGQLLPVSDGPRIGPQPAMSYWYFIQPTDSGTTGLQDTARAGEAEPGAPPER